MTNQRITIELPWAPSTNNFLRHYGIKIKNKNPEEEDTIRVATTISERGREFYAAVSKMIHEGDYEMLKGPLFGLIELYPPDRRSIDVDNRNKPVLDSLKCRPRDTKQILNSWIFDNDDSQVKCLMTIMLDVIRGGRVVVTLKQIDPRIFYKKIRMLFLDDECPGPDSSVEQFDFAHKEKTLFE